ncbi:MAG: alpha/beta fold hydrolase [Acidimicrobiales bacterium]
MLAYERLGSGSPLVLIHGLTDTRRVWDPLLAPLAANFDVLSVDLRGHGESFDAAPYDVVTLASDVHEVVEELALDGPLVVGHSLGGFVATAYASRFDCSGVVNIDQSLDLAAFQAMVGPFQAQLSDPDQFEPTMLMVFATMRGALNDEQWDRLARERRFNQRAVLGIWSTIFDLDAAGLDVLVDSITRPIGAPYLALHGSPLLTHYESWLAERVATARLIEWPERGHLPHLVEPDRFVALIQRVAAASATPNQWRRTELEPLD